MNCIRFLRLPALVAAGLFLATGPSLCEDLPRGASKPALTPSWFPSRLHAFVWKNWESVPVERMAKVIGATPEDRTSATVKKKRDRNFIT